MTKIERSFKTVQLRVIEQLLVLFEGQSLGESVLGIYLFPLVKVKNQSKCPGGGFSLMGAASFRFLLFTIGSFSQGIKGVVWGNTLMTLV